MKWWTYILALIEYDSWSIEGNNGKKMVTAIETSANIFNWTMSLNGNCTIWIFVCFDREKTRRTIYVFDQYMYKLSLIVLFD